MGNRGDSSWSQMGRLVVMGVIEATYPWRAAQTLAHTSSDTEGYIALLSLHSPIFILRQSRPATEDDILRLCQSFHNLTREFIKEIMAELWKGNARKDDQENYNADDESDGDVPRRRLRKPRARLPGIR